MPWSFASGSFGASSSTFGSAFASCTGFSIGFFSSSLTFGFGISTGAGGGFGLSSISRRTTRCGTGWPLAAISGGSVICEMIALNSSVSSNAIAADLRKRLSSSPLYTQEQQRFARLLVDLALDLPFVAELLFLVLHFEQRALDRVDRVVAVADLLRAAPPAGLPCG